MSESRNEAPDAPSEGRIELQADCARCTGLCCVAPAFAASADFAIDKAAGQPCLHLQADFRCGIHANLRKQGFSGCMVYDCFGAGQRVTQIVFGGQDWRLTQRTALRMFAVFQIMRQLHELLWYLTEALAMQPAGPLHNELRRALDETDCLTNLCPEALVELDIAAHRSAVNSPLRRTSKLVRSAFNELGQDRSGADLIGARLAGADLRGASLRGTSLVGADLRGADLRVADFTGADVRGTDLRGANLTGALFVTQSQLNAARGDATTRLPSSSSLTRPSHWPS